VAQEVTPSEKPPKDQGRAKPGEGPKTVPLAALPAPLRKLLEETPRKQWYELRAIRATYQETIELAQILGALQYLRKVTPDKLLRRVTEGQLEERVFYGAYRDIRDQIRLLREKCMHLAALSQVDVKAWTDGRGRKRKKPEPAPGAGPENVKKVS
jgi:hypothetical protein